MKPELRSKVTITVTEQPDDYVDGQTYTLVIANFLLDGEYRGIRLSLPGKKYAAESHGAKNPRLLGWINYAVSEFGQNVIEQEMPLFVGNYEDEDMVYVAWCGDRIYTATGLPNDDSFCYINHYEMKEKTDQFWVSTTNAIKQRGGRWNSGLPMKFVEDNEASDYYDNTDYEAKAYNSSFGYGKDPYL